MPSNVDALDAPCGVASEKPTQAQRRWLQSGLSQPGGKLPLFDHDGQRVPANTIKSCLRQGWAEPWFSNPLKPDWVVCKLTHLGRVVAEEDIWDIAG